MRALRVKKITLRIRITVRNRGPDVEEAGRPLASATSPVIWFNRTSSEERSACKFTTCNLHAAIGA